ncbi:MAG TPA: ABC transporter substrate binding protein, partial [Candidatus Limnocylindrales bacterium]|nr:ABC transporter substrate binding protein [Candidatus Limnocylindrales bacterium]
MHKISLSEVSQAFSDKLKPKPRRAISRITQNRKWFAATTFVVTVALHSAQAEAQKTTEPGAQAARPVTAAYAGESSRGESRPRQYVDGKNKVSDGKSTNDSRDRLQTLANDLVRRDVDILVASSTAEALAFKNATRTIPIVFVVSSDPVAAGLVDSLAQPGGNITGITTNLTALAGKRLELLKEAVPK